MAESFCVCVLYSSVLACDKYLILRAVFAVVSQNIAGSLVE